jgi:hypothetical protein
MDLQQFPSAKVERHLRLYAQRMDWLKRLRLAGVRIADGCSASVVSPDGLVMTNRHCAHAGIQNLSGKRSSTRTVSSPGKEEEPCPGMRITNQLTAIPRCDQSRWTQPKKHTPTDKFNPEVQKAAISGIEKECTSRNGVVTWSPCSVVDSKVQLVQAAMQDIRLVFALQKMRSHSLVVIRTASTSRYQPRRQLPAHLWRRRQTLEDLPFAKTRIRDGRRPLCPGNPGSTMRGMTIAFSSIARQRVIS